ncbi:hypothetical protein FGB62_229g07 [Gracilaria domingensis]|nr:hypothetical protein FGB62_229g07 [Gracilaria domingensis]
MEDARSTAPRLVVTALMAVLLAVMDTIATDTCAKNVPLRTAGMAKFVATGIIATSIVQCACSVLLPIVGMVKCVAMVTTVTGQCVVVRE